MDIKFCLPPPKLLSLNSFPGAMCLVCPCRGVEEDPLYLWNSTGGNKLQSSAPQGPLTSGFINASHYLSYPVTPKEKYAVGFPEKHKNKTSRASNINTFSEFHTFIM